MTLLFLDSWFEFAGMPVEAPLDGLVRELLTGYSLEAKKYREHIREYNSAMTFT